MGISSIHRVLKKITFNPSCLDMGWQWEVRMAFSTDYLIRVSFQRPDTDTGEIGRGFGRWWQLDEHASESAIVKTAWLACQQVVQHELMEAFSYEGVRVFDPHAPVSHLVAANMDLRPT